MRIILLLLAAIAIGYLAVRINRARHGSSSPSKRLSNRQQRVADHLAAIDDPRVAAAAMMVAAAEQDGTITEQEETIIVEHCMTQFEFDEPTSLKLLKHAETAVRKIDNLEICFHILAPTIRDTWSPDECDQLLDALATIALQSSDASTVSISNAVSNLRNQLTSV